MYHPSADRFSGRWVKIIPFIIISVMPSAKTHLAFTVKSVQLPSDLFKSGSDTVSTVVVILLSVLTFLDACYCLAGVNVKEIALFVDKITACEHYSGLAEIVGVAAYLLKAGEGIAVFVDIILCSVHGHKRILYSGVGDIPVLAAALVQNDTCGFYAA